MLNPSKSASLRAQFLTQLSISRKQQQSITQLEAEKAELLAENANLVEENSNLKNLLKRSIYSHNSSRYNSATRITHDNSSISR